MPYTCTRGCSVYFWREGFLPHATQHYCLLVQREIDADVVIHIANAGKIFAGNAQDTKYPQVLKLVSLSAMQAQNKDLSTALQRAWSCQKTAQAQLQAQLSTMQSQGQTAESRQAACEQQSAARRQQDEGRLSRAIQAFEHAASRMNQKPAPPQGAIAAAVGTSMALEAPSAAEEAHRKLQADYDALLSTLGVCGQLFVALGRPAVTESIMAYLQGAKASDAPQQQQQQQPEAA